MKKKISLILLVMIAVTSTISAFVIFDNPPVTDGAEYLTEVQFDEISQQLDAIRKKYNFDVAVYTEEFMSGANAQSTADDLYDYTGFGYGEKADGIMLYIAADERVYHFTTHGKGEEVFNENGLAYLEKMILPSLKDGNYYSAIKCYAEHSEELLEMAAHGKPFNKRQLSMEYICGVVGCALIIPLILAFLMTRIKLKKMKTAVENDYAANYMKPDSMKLSFSKDIFLYSTMIKTEKPKSNSDGHVSSSGEHHGGRGGSF